MIDQKHQNGGSMDGIYVNSAVFIFRGGHPYSMGVILKNACDSIAKSVVGEWEGAVPFVELSLSLDGGSQRIVATICLSQLRKTKKLKPDNAHRGVANLSSNHPDFNNFLSFQIEVKFIELPMNQHCIREVHPSYTRYPLLPGPSQPPHPLPAPRR